MSKDIEQLKRLWPKVPDWAKKKILKIAAISVKQEFWKTVTYPPGKFEQAIRGRYEVSNLGRLRHKKTGRIVSQYYVALYARSVHILVAYAFCGDRPEKSLVRHLDGDGSNNYADNLKWGTPLENAKDKKKHNK